MSPVKREWLVHGCMRLSDYDEKNRVSLKVRNLISQMYGGEEFSIRSWPQRDFRDTLWWSEKSIDVPGSAASYFLTLDNRRGPNLYAGITVEKAYEDDELAREAATKYDQPLRRWRLDESWDWHRFVSSLNQIKPLILSAAEALQSELYLWLEFGEGGIDSQHYVLSQSCLYWRGGFKPIEWEELHKFVIQPRPKLWGGVFLARAFTLDECTPHLDEARLMDVFQSMRPIRDYWRGVLS
jgi:hypothetical protein